MKARSLSVIVIILLCCFGGVLGVTIYSNLRLQSFQETLSKANNLLLTWNKSESVTKEFFLTYDLNRARKRWLNIKNQFEENFRSFLHSPGTRDIIENDADFQLKIEMIKMHWEVNRKKFEGVDKKLNTYLEENKSGGISGNLLVTFGENVFTGKYSDNLIDLLGDLRWCTSFYVFTQVLTNISQHVKKNIQEQTRRLHFTSFLLLALILGTAGIFILYRMLEMKRGQETSRQHAIALSAEIDERKRTEELLRTERDKLRGVLNAMGEGMYIVNHDFDIEYQNDILGRRYGDLTGKKCFSEYMKSTNPCTFCLARKTIELRNMHQAEMILNNGRNYELFFSPFSDVDGEIKAIILMRDVTENKRLEAEAMRAGHLASIGELAAGIAHEINNPINGIISIAEILKDQYYEKGENDEIPTRIIKEGERIAEIAKNLLSFARDRKEEHSPANIQDILSDSFGLVERQIIKDGIKLSMVVPSDLPQIKARSREIQQVFLNIISNARYALNKKFPGFHEDKILEIRGENKGIEGKRHVRLTFSDHGVGIPEDIMDKICNPFFSTKPRSEGTGLGLSISHGIIKSHGGRLTFQSVPGEYTRVIIDLPANNAREVKNPRP